MSLCVLPHRLGDVTIDIDTGVEEAARYVQDLRQEYTDSFGNVGYTNDE